MESWLLDGMEVLESSSFLLMVFCATCCWNTSCTCSIFFFL